MQYKEYGEGEPVPPVMEHVGDLEAKSTMVIMVPCVLSSSLLMMLPSGAIYPIVGLPAGMYRFKIDLLPVDVKDMQDIVLSQLEGSAEIEPLNKMKPRRFIAWLKAMIGK